MECVSQLIQEAKGWLSLQREPEPGSTVWYSHGNLRSFISTLESDGSSTGIQRAVHALRHHVVDQMDWSADYCKAISGFCQAADRIQRAMTNE